MIWQILKLFLGASLCIVLRSFTSPKRKLRFGVKCQKYTIKELIYDPISSLNGFLKNLNLPFFLVSDVYTGYYLIRRWTVNNRAHTAISIHCQLNHEGIKLINDTVDCVRCGFRKLVASHFDAFFVHNTQQECIKSITPITAERKYCRRIWT